MSEVSLQLYDTLAREKRTFTPMDASNVRMYVCGPTVYARPHIGNARSVVVYDVLFRLLRHLYGDDCVTYARNITDVDDKINAAAIERGISIQALTQEVTAQFHADIDALNCLSPTHEPRATEHIDGMIRMIESLIRQGHAYVGSDGAHVLFDVTSYTEYGKLSGRMLEDQQAGARIAVEDYKRHPGDFVLWKPADAQDDESSKFDSPWGVGRPGWHIECSVMSNHHLGADFDIHGGGADLKFPHHENEIAQSRCAAHGSHYARYWVHNGFLTVNGEKMSKSLGNFITVRDLLDKGVKGEVIRLALLMSKYNEPLDWNDKLVEQAKSILDALYGAYYMRFYEKAVTLDSEYKTWLERYKRFQTNGEWLEEWDSQDAKQLYYELLDLMANDLNCVAYRMNDFYRTTDRITDFVKFRAKGFVGNEQLQSYSAQKFFSYRVQLKKFCNLLGILQQSSEEWFKGAEDATITSRIEQRAAAKKARDFDTADRIRDELKAEGIILEDRPDGTTDWRRQ